VESDVKFYVVRRGNRVEKQAIFLSSCFYRENVIEFWPARQNVSYDVKLYVV